LAVSGCRRDEVRFAASALGSPALVLLNGGQEDGQVLERGFDGGDLRGPLVTLGAQEGQGLPHHLPVAVAGLVHDVVHPGGVERVTVLLLDDAAEGPCAALGAPQVLDEAEDRGGVRRSNELGVSGLADRAPVAAALAHHRTVRGVDLPPVGVREPFLRRLPRPGCGCLGLALQVVDPVSGGHQLFSLSVRWARAASTSASSRAWRRRRHRSTYSWPARVPWP